METFFFIFSICHLTMTKRGVPACFCLFSFSFLVLFFFSTKIAVALNCCYGSPQCEGPGWYSEDRGQTANFCCSKYHSISSSTVGYLRCVQSIGFASITNPKQEKITNCKTF